MSNKCNYPKVLVPTINVWKDSGANPTMMDIFSDWNPDHVAQIYTRSGVPSTKVCNNFFQISETLVRKSVFRRKVKTGSVLQNDTAVSEEMQEIDQKEIETYGKFRKRRSWFLVYMREMVWKFGKWHTKELDKFVEEFKPDLLFMPIYPTIYMGKIQSYLIKKYKLPVISYLADDNYTFRDSGFNPFAYLHRLFLRRRVRYIVKKSHKLFVISPMQKEFYDKIFKIDSDILTRGVTVGDINDFGRKSKEGEPIKIVYTGKLIIGRESSITKLAQYINEINKNGIKFRLEVYSQDKPSPKMLKEFDGVNTVFGGRISRQEVSKVQKNADVLLFVESLERKYKYKAFLSFTTKLTDYLASGKCIIAIGAEDISPIHYLRKEDCALIATTNEEIKDVLVRILDNPEVINEYGEKSIKAAVKNHDKKKLDKLVHDTIVEAIESK